MTKTSKKSFAQPKSPTGRLAHSLSFSLYPSHQAILAGREKEFNVQRSILLQILLEIEQREGLLRRELITRLRTAPAIVPFVQPEPPTTLDSTN
jgi:hypothetical protein